MAFTLSWLEAAELPKWLAEVQNGPVLINHWATWCSSCVEELTLLGDLHRKFQEKVRFIGFSWDRFEQFDSEEETLKWIRGLAEQHQLEFEIVVFRGTPEQLFEALELEEKTIPQTFLFDAEGTLRFHHVGGVEEPTANQKLEGALEKV